MNTTKDNKKYTLIKESSYGCGYGYFRTEPENKSIKVPDASKERLILIENDSFLVTTRLENFKKVLSDFLNSEKITAAYRQHCLENLILVDTNIFSLSTSLPHKDKMQKKHSLLRRIIMRLYKGCETRQQKEFMHRDEPFFKKFTDFVIYQTAFSIWDKELNEFAQEIEFYQTKDNPAPGCGNKKDCFACNGKEFYSTITSLY